MSSYAVGLISASCLLGGLFLGYFLGHSLPEHHLNDKSKDSIKMASGMIATLSALVLGLLVASAKNTFDTIESADNATGATIILLDRTLAQYGPEAKPAREALKESVNTELGTIWPEKHPIPNPPDLESAGDLEAVQRTLDRLNPTTDNQRDLLQQARQLLNSLVQARYQLIEESQAEVPTPLYVVLLSWLTILFISIGLFAPRNPTVIAALALCIISFSTAIFLFDEMAGPLDGLIKVSSTPLEKAWDHLAHQGQ